MGSVTRLRALAAAALLVPAGASARPTASLGLRLGWAASAGNASEHVPMSEAIESELPIEAEALLWATDRLAAGAYASWAFGLVGGGACADGASCSATGIRAGAQGTWTFPPSSFGASPWLGAALGWEWATQERERLGATTTTRWNGPELALQGGAEWRVEPRLTVGPFALVGIGRYGGVSVDTGAASASEALGSRAVHAWIHVGVRGTIDL